MRLEKIRLWNFRKFGSDNSTFDLTQPNLEVPFSEGLNVLIGENDSGKTAIVDAIKLVLDTHSSEWNRLTAEDFHNDTERLRIECHFSDLQDVEASHFTEWLGMAGEGDTAKPVLKVILDATKKGNERLYYDIRAGSDDEGTIMNAEAREYLRTIYLKPLRDAKSELIPRKNSRLSQILSGLSIFKGKDNDHRLKLMSKCWNCLFKKYFKAEFKPKDCIEAKCPHEDFFYPDPASKSEGEGIRNNLQGYIKSFLGTDQYQVGFDVVERELKNILEQLKLSLGEDNLGLGSQNLLFIATELLNLQRENWTGLRLALIEELEAHLHPQAQLRVVEYFEHFAKQNKNVQIILTTHSPNLASKIKLENLIICHNKQVFPLTKGLTKLDPDDYIFLEKFLDVTKANLFFAKGVIFVEGWSEELLLPAIAKKIGINLTEKGVSIVNVGSTAFLHYSKIFQRNDTRKMKVPVAVITDLDVKPEDESTQTEEGKTKKVYVTEEKKKEHDGQTVKTFVSPHWTLEYCINKSSSLCSAFKTVVKQIHPKIDDDSTFEDGLKDKLEKGSSAIKKTEIARSFAQKIESDDTLIIDPNDEPIKYLIDAIKYVTI